MPHYFGKDKYLNAYSEMKIRQQKYTKYEKKAMELIHLNYSVNASGTHLYREPGHSKYKNCKRTGRLLFEIVHEKANTKALMGKAVCSHLHYLERKMQKLNADQYLRYLRGKKKLLGSNYHYY